MLKHFCVLALAIVPAGCDDGRPIRYLEGRTPVRTGPLTMTPIEFATTDFYFRPSTTPAEEGRLQVRESRDQAGGRMLELRFVRFRARGGGSEAPIVYLAGGPGASGIYSASGDRHRLFMRLRTVGDVIALDQRGAGLSMPAPWCPGTWSYPLERPHDDSTMAAVLGPYLRRCTTHWSDSLDVSAFNTLESVEDLEDLRLALGAPRLKLLGISYGTHLALAYMRRYPERVERAVLAGVEGPDHTWKLPANIEMVLRRVDSAIAADPGAHRVVPDFLGSLRSAISRLDARPVTVEVAHPRTGQRHRITVGGDDLRRAVLNVMGERERLERMLERLLPIFAGDYTLLAQRAALTRMGNEERVMTLSMDCSSGATRQRLELIRGQATETILGDVANADLRARCASWPHRDLGDAFRSPLASPTPVLFVSGTLDPRTPVSNAEEVGRGFPAGRHLVIEGAAHDDDLLLSSHRIAELMLRFLDGHDVPSQRITLPPLRFDH